MPPPCLGLLLERGFQAWEEHFCISNLCDIPGSCGYMWRNGPQREHWQPGGHLAGGSHTGSGDSYGSYPASRLSLYQGYGKCFFFLFLGYFYSQVAKDLARRREQQGLLGKGGSFSLSLSALTKRSCSEVGEWDFCRELLFSQERERPWKGLGKGRRKVESGRLWAPIAPSERLLDACSLPCAAATQVCHFLS